MPFGFKVRVRGPRACFTRPELSVERVSYDVITPSAAVGLLKAVYWKPSFEWVVDRIEVLSPVRFESIKRNEVKSKMRRPSAAEMKAGPKGLGIDATAQRTQRFSLILRDVDYLVDCHLELTDVENADHNLGKHLDTARRRLERGACFSQPYLGCREFPAEVALLRGRGEAPVGYFADAGERDLGLMLHSLDYSKDEAHPAPRYFRAVMRNGVIDVSGAEVLS